MAELAFDLQYDGEALETHEMDVRDLAPALLSAADLFQAANETLNPADPPVSVNVRALSEGSFLVQLKLVYDASRDALLSPDVQAGVTLSALLGSVGWLVRLLRERVKSRAVAEEPGDEPGTVRITFEDGTTLEIPESVIRLERSVRVRRSLVETIRPVQRDGISSVRIVQDDIVIGELDESDLSAFEVGLPGPPRETLNDNTRETYLTILSATFQEGRKWRLSDGMSSFYASLSDQAFLERIDSGEQFSKQDVLHCRIHTTQWRDETGLHQDVDVVEVLAHLPRVIEPQIEQRDIYTILEVADSDPDDGPAELGPGSTD